VKAALFHGLRDMTLGEITVPEVGSGMVKIKVEYCGICGSDLHEYLEGPREYRTHNQMGHELSGVVAEAGADVTKVRVGDKVTVEPHVPCGKCENCKRGSTHWCTQTFTYFNKGLSEYVVVNQENLHVLPEEMSLELGALVEPAAVALGCVRSSKFKVGNSVVIFGAGPIGLLVLEVVKAAGASKIFMVEINDSRRSLAEKLGATVINPNEGNVVETILLLSGGGVDVAYEAAGVEATFRAGIASLKKGGELMVVSVFEKPVSFNPRQIVITGKTINVSLGYANTFPKVIRMLANGTINGEALITSKISLNDVVEKGFEALANNRSECKILVSPLS
jgi:(R,R)-butanediol dehydrogenase / meso-butanediol dehydrogenase / diacetyl reductase